MAINPSNTLTYGTLIDHIVNWISGLCQNVGGYANIVHASVKPNYSVPVSYEQTNWEHRYNPGNARATYYRTTCQLIYTTRASTIIGTTTAAQITSDLNNFLSARNLTQRRDCIVTTSGLLNLWNNITCFLYKHLVNVTSNFIPDVSYTMYWAASPYAYGAATNQTDAYTVPMETCITALDINEMLATLQDTYNPTWRTHIVQFDSNLVDSTANLGNGSSGRYSWTGELHVPYSVNQVIFESSNPGIHDVLLRVPGNYQIILVGAGGGSAVSTDGTNTNIGAGGSGGYTDQTVYLGGGTYAVQVGRGGIGLRNTNGIETLGYIGGNSRVGQNVAYGGKGATCCVINPGKMVGGMGGAGNNARGISGGTSHTSVSATAASYGNYGRGGSANTTTANSGGNGYVKIIFKGA